MDNNTDTLWDLMQPDRVQQGITNLKELGTDQDTIDELIELEDIANERSFAQFVIE